MGAAKRRGTLENRIAQTVDKSRRDKHRATRFVHLCRLISPRATRESIIACGRNRGFIITEGMGLPQVRFSQQGKKVLPYLMMVGASLFTVPAVGYSLLRKGFR
jgi:hypothetical protein